MASEPAPSPEQYEAALQSLAPLSDKRLLMLWAHYSAPERTITAAQMAEALGYPHYATANAQYGMLAAMVGDLVGYSPTAEKLGTLVVFEMRNAEWHWILRQEVALALERLDWITTPRGSGRSDETSFKHAEFFPVVARLIMQETRQNPDVFVSHESLVDCVLADVVAATMVQSARAKSSWADDRIAASNMVAWFSQQITVGRSQWAQFFQRERFSDAWAYRPIAAATATAISDVEIASLEGDPRMFFNLRRERDPGLVQAKRAASLDAAGRLRCEACHFVVEEAYPGWDGGPICEVHHSQPLGEAEGAVTTRLEDLAILCPSCHRAIHRTRPLLSVEEFRERFGLAI